MDSRTLLDRALFQLTPTRTRFELMLFAKGKKEKFASGLFDPFVSHLKVARDEISKGGYSISLQPSSRDASWFSKGTFERFVRFVSTPAVLERFVSLEAEIKQIESSIQQDSSGISLVGNCDVRKSSESSKLTGEGEGKDETSVEENSKMRLQRLLESRKTLLRKEQAMAYARGLVAGFDNENMDDLISFSDAFGASRLREACTNFKELCKKKHADVLWMEELAAVEALSPSELSIGASGIILANDSSISVMESSKSHATPNSDSSKDQTQPASAKHQVPLNWQNQFPQYMYNFQGPIPQFPFYQGYPLPPVQPGSINYPTNMQRYYNRSQKSSSRKKEKLKTSEADSGESTETESSISDSESNSDSQAHRLDETSEYRKKHRKKSSRTVVIRNINYITPNKRNKEKGQGYTESSDEDDPIRSASLKRDIDGAAGLLETSDNLHRDRDSVTSRQGRASDAWGALQDLLMKNEDSSGVKTSEPMDVVRTSHGEFTNAPGTVDLESEKYYAKRKVSSDSFIATQRIGESETNGVAINFINGENGNSVLKRRDSGADDFLIPNRIEEPGNNPNDIISTVEEQPLIIRSAEDEEWFIVGQSVEPAGNRNSMTEQSIFGGDPILPVDSSDIYMKGNNRERLIDDSFMVASRLEVDDQYDSQWKTEISMAGDIIMASKAENGTADVESKRNEPNTLELDDLCMVFERDSDFDSMKNSWSMEYGNDLSIIEATTRCIGTESDKSANLKLPSDTELKGNGDSKVKVPVKETKSKVSPGSLRKSRTEIVPKSKKPSFVNRTIIHKSKFEQEEEMRKRMEELAIKRQKRIAERTAASANASPASRKMASESKTSKNSMTNRNLANRVNPVKLRVG